MTTDNILLDRHLFYASAAVEAIDENVKKMPHYQKLLDKACITNDKVFSGGFLDDLLNVDVCLVGDYTGESGNAVVVSFRGTIPLKWDVKSLVDWIFADGCIDEESVPKIPGIVHHGFWTALNTLWNDIINEVEARRNRDGKKIPVYITGHSKGGALATLATARLYFQNGYLPDEMYTCTFAGARVGNEAFANGYDVNKTGIKHIRYEYADDIVPHLPPRGNILDWLIEEITHHKGHFPHYHSVGKLKYYRDGKFWDESFGLEAERIVWLGLAFFFHGGLKKLSGDHNLIGHNSGYQQAVGADDVTLELSVHEIADLLEKKGLKNIETFKSTATSSSFN